MLAIQATAAAPKRTFANDGSYESVERMILGWALKVHGRVMGMGGLSMTHDDIVQLGNLTYVQARDKWSPEGSSKFSTYLMTCLMHNGNQVIKRLARERRVLGMVPMSQLLASGDQAESEISGPRRDSVGSLRMDDTIERYPGDPKVVGHGEASHTERMGDNPELRLQNAQERNLRLRNLSKQALQLVGTLIKQSEEGEDPPSLRKIAADLGIEGTELRRVKHEILTTFGVKWL